MDGTISKTLVGKVSRSERRARDLKECERRDYDTVAPYYDELITPLTGVFGRRTLDLLDIKKGMKVLEVACGSGEIIGKIGHHVGEGGAITCLDQSEGMLAIARKRVSDAKLGNVELICGDAEYLSGVPKRAYDRVLCVFGLMYLPNPAGALRAMYEALAPGGLAAGTVWSMPADVVGLTAPMEAGARILPPPPLNWFMRTGPGRKILYRKLLKEKPGGGNSPMCLAPSGKLEGLFRLAGFKNVRRYEYSRTFTYKDFDEYWNALMGTPARTVVNRYPAETVRRVREECAKLLSARRGVGGEGLPVPMKALTVVGEA